MEIKELSVISLKENEMLLITLPAGTSEEIVESIRKDSQKFNSILKDRVIVTVEDVKFSKIAVDK